MSSERAIWPIPEKEPERLASVARVSSLRKSPDAAFGYIAKVAAEHFGAPIALVSIVDDDEQWFAGAHGLSASSTPREQAFCGHAIFSDEVMVVEDATQDVRFATNPLVADDPSIRFYAGAPLVADDGVRIGTVCVIDRKPRQFSLGQRIVLRNLAKVALEELARVAQRDHEGANSRQWGADVCS